VSEALKVGDLSIPDFIKILTNATKRADNADPVMGDLSVKDFLREMNAVTQSQAFKGAQQEQMIAQQVMQDWAGIRNILAITQPYRIESREDYERFVRDLGESVSGKARLVVAVALLQPDGSYGAVR
jgi:hypothetical protein